MKKIMIGTFVAALLTSGAAAEESFFDYKQEIGLGVSVIDVRDSLVETGYGININGKLMRSINENIAVGITINADYNPSVEIKNQSSNPKEYFIDLLPTVTYVIDKKVDVSAMFGYEFGKYDAAWGKWDTEGWSYGLAASYAIDEHLRVNLQFLRTNMEYTGNGNDETENMNRYTLGLGYNF